MQDLSKMAKGSLIAGASMAGGNTISEVPFGSLEPSSSEATQDVDTHGNPNIDEGTPTDKYTRNPEHPAYHAAPLDWKKLK